MDIPYRPEFDDMRPYIDREIPAAMARIAGSDVFPIIAHYLYPEVPLEDVRERMLGYETVRDFQFDAMKRVNERVIELSVSEFSWNGTQRLAPGLSYLYVSNHRDIMLDACLLQYALYRDGFDSTEITFGANLMTNPVVVDIGRSNKMFRVERPGGGMREFYVKSRHLSDYIRYVLKERNQSVWIAQRNGRAKDGNDFTEPGVVKMLGMSSDKGDVLGLHIVPMAISYEWEPCDILKAVELYISSQATYVKQPGEDLNSILTGIMQPKGRVHIELGEPLMPYELGGNALSSGSEYVKAVTALIDYRIHTNYRLYPNNYIAYDLRNGCSRFADKYDKTMLEAFKDHMEGAIAKTEDRYNDERLRDIFLGIYSNPVKNKLAVLNK